MFRRAASSTRAHPRLGRRVVKFILRSNAASRLFTFAVRRQDEAPPAGRTLAGQSPRRFLMDVVGALPFPLLSIQVDGGSEFIADFEEVGIPLHVLPPRRPQWNGCVERTNRWARAEF